MAVVAYSFCEPLPLSDPAYDEIVKQVRASYPRACITMIDCIRNPTVEATYEEGRAALAAKGAPVTEYTVYHGTKAAVVESICSQGFLPTKGRTMAYGYGIYFAKNFSYSHGYAPVADYENDKMSYVFVCQILPGRMFRGPANQLPPYGLDSSVDNPENPYIFAIPKAEQMKPVYLVRFSKEAETTFVKEEPPLTNERLLTDKEARRLTAALAAQVSKIERAAAKRGGKKGV